MRLQRAPFDLRPRVGFVVDLFHPLDRHMSVDLGRRETGMTQERLHGTQIGAVIEEVGGKTVAQFVRAHILRNVAEGVVFLKEIRDRPSREPSPHFADEKRSIQDPGCVPIAMNRFRCGSSDRANTLLTAFSKDTDTLIV